MVNEGLIQITENEGRRVVNARDLHLFLVVEAKCGQVGEDYTHWIKRYLCAVDAVINEDYVVHKYNYLGDKINESDNQHVSKTDYIITTDIAKEISILQNNDRGKQARKYFIDKEKELSQIKSTQLSLPDFNNPVIAARAWADAMEQKQLALQEANNQKAIAEAAIEADTTSKKQLEVAIPLISKAEAVMATIEVTQGTISINECAKVIGIKVGEFYDYLRNNNYTFKKGNNSSFPYAHHGRLFEVRTSTYENVGVRFVTTTTYVTPYGIVYFSNKCRKKQENCLVVNN